MRESAAASGSQRMLKWSIGPARTPYSHNIEMPGSAPDLGCRSCEREWSGVLARRTGWEKSGCSACLRITELFVTRHGTQVTAIGQLQTLLMDDH